jgi:hypothetical protein
MMFFGLVVSSLVTTNEDIIIKGEVVDVVEYDNYLHIFMDTGYDYKITYPEDAIDLTVNSKIILKLKNINWFWIDDGIWEVDSIVKVPNTDYNLEVTII